MWDRCRSLGGIQGIKKICLCQRLASEVIASKLKNPIHTALTTMASSSGSGFLILLTSIVNFEVIVIYGHYSVLVLLVTESA